MNRSRIKKIFKVKRVFLFTVLFGVVVSLTFIKYDFVTWNGIINNMHLFPELIIGEDNLVYAYSGEQERTYKNVEAMRVATVLKAGDRSRTKGFYEPHDGGAAQYQVRKKKPGDVIDNGKLISLQNGNVAELVIKGRMSIRQFGAKEDIMVDNSPIINTALKSAKAILIPEGRFGIGSIIRLQSGNDVKFNGELYVNTGKRSVSFSFFDGKTETPGYTGVHDVYIHGKGVYDANGIVAKNGSTPFRVHHCNNIVIEGITIRDYYYFHAIEVGGTDGFTCRNVTFSGAIPVVNNAMEAIQIEVISRDGTNGAIPYDGTPTKNVLIESCSFRPSDTNESVMRCPIGIHNYSKNRPYENVEIKNCVFETTDQKKFGAINFMYNVKNLKIHNNIFITKGRPAINLYNKTTDAIIRNNEFY